MASGEHKSHRDRYGEVVTRLFDNDGNRIFDPETFKGWVKEQNVVRACGIVHDRDVYTLDDCYRDEHGQPLPKPEGEPVPLPAGGGDDTEAPEEHIVGYGYLGDPKPDHFHGPFEFVNARSYARIAKQLGLPVGCIQKPTGRYEGELSGHAFDGMATYDTHKADDQQAMGKALYFDDEVWTYNYNYTEETAAYLNLRAKASTKRMKKAEIDAVTNDIHAGKMGIRDVVEKYGYAFYHDHKKAFDDARQEYLASDAFTIPMRTNIYIGPDAGFAKAHPNDLGGLGKTQLAKRIAMGLTPDLTQRDAFHKVSDMKVAFDRYVEQPTIIFSESRPGGFMGILGRETTFNILETHPDKDAVSIKYGDRVLVNSFNVVEGIVPWRQFLESLAGEYVDKRGEHHDAEARTQAYRRFALVIALTPTTFDLYGNKGVFMGDDTSLTSFMHMAHGEVNVAKLMRTYGGPALGEVFKPVVDAVVDSVTKLIDMQAARKEAIEDIVPDDKPMLTFYEPGMGMEYDDVHPDGFIPAEVRERCRELVDGLSGSFSEVERLLDAGADDEESLGAIEDALNGLLRGLDKPWMLTDGYLMAEQRALEYERQVTSYEEEQLRKYPLLGFSTPRKPVWVRDGDISSAVFRSADGCLIGGERVDELAHAFERYRKLRHRYESLCPDDKDGAGISIGDLFPDG